MDKKYLKEVADLTDDRSHGRRRKLIDGEIVLKNGKVQKRMPFKSIDDVHNEMIACVNYILKGDEFLNTIKSIEYSNYEGGKRKVVLFDLSELSINGVPIPKEQLKPNSRVKDFEHMRNTNSLAFELFSF